MVESLLDSSERSNRENSEDCQLSHLKQPVFVLSSPTSYLVICKENQVFRSESIAPEIHLYSWRSSSCKETPDSYRNPADTYRKPRNT